MAWDRRWYGASEGVKIHTRSEPWPEEAVLVRRGMLVTNAERAIVEAVEGRCRRKLLREAVRAASENGAVDRHRLMDRARRRRPRRVVHGMADLLEDLNRADAEEFMAELRRLAPPPT